jgi:Dihaem cytochrome c
MRTQFSASLAITALAAIIGAWFAVGAAESATTLRPREAFEQECGACHWAFAPEFLPARSWQAITSDLSHHFGQNASLDDATTRQITRFLANHAADVPGSNHLFMRGLSANDTPLRITDTPIWRAIHREVNPLAFTQPRIKTRANCMGCHRG